MLVQLVCRELFAELRIVLEILTGWLSGMLSEAPTIWSLYLILICVSSSCMVVRVTGGLETSVHFWMVFLYPMIKVC